MVAGAQVVLHQRSVMKKKVGFVQFVAGAVVLVAIAGYLYGKRPIDGNPIPTLSPRNGDADASAEYLNAQKAVQFYRDEIHKNPDAVKNYIELAQIFLQEARVTATHHDYVPKATSLLEEALKRDPDNFEALITKASMLLTLHHFSEARDISEKALRTNPYNAACYSTLVDALVESGEYDQAVTVCDKLMSVRPNLPGYARVSYLRELHGDTQGAKEAMKMAADAGIYGQEQRAWALYNLGNLFLHEGKLDTAEFIYKGILEERSNYAYALSGLAHVRYAQRKSGEAVELLKTAYDLMPEHAFLEQLVDLYKALDRKEEADKTIQRVLQEFKDHNVEGWNVAREYAMFAANQGINLPEALSLAESEYKSRPNNIEALQTYSWTLHKNGRSTQALPYIERALRLGTQNAVLFYQTGVIYRAAGKVGQGNEYFHKALTLSPRFHPLFADDARRELGLNSTIAYQN